MTGLVIGLIVLVAVVVIGVVIGLVRGVREHNRFATYLAEHFPDLPETTDMLCAWKQSKGKDDVALVVDDKRGHLIVMEDHGRDGVSHLTYPFSALRGVESTSRVISRGAPTARIYSFEQTMTVTFSDGSSVPFRLETISNKHGTDKAPETVGAMLDPWVRRLDNILHHRTAA
jgi:hypothetical protein